MDQILLDYALPGNTSAPRRLVIHYGLEALVMRFGLGTLWDHISEGWEPATSRDGQEVHLTHTHWTTGVSRA